jgi:hypothetical protein
MVEALIAVLAFSSFFGLIIWLVIRDKRQWREGLSDIRSRRGWGIRGEARIEGRSAQAVVVAAGAPGPEANATWPHPDPDGREEDWLAAAVSSTGSKGKKGGSSRPGYMEWRAPAPRWDAGILVLGPPLPRAAREQANALLARLDHPLARTLLAKVFGDALMGNLPDLRYLPAPDGMEPPFSVFSSGNPGDRVLLGAVADVIAETKPFKGDAMSNAPIIVLAPEGMRVRVNRTARSPAEVERFVDLALRLQQAMVPRG